MLTLRHRQSGFTIVELLIVIVVIAILATISIVTYRGVQDRARNAARVDAVVKFRKALIMYATEHGEYPLGGTQSACLGEISDFPDICWNGGRIQAFNEAIRPYLGGTLPNSNPNNECLIMYGSCRRGAAYSNQEINLDGQSHTFSISYLLKGDVVCQGDGQAGGTWSNASSTPNAFGYIERSSGTTLCRLILPNPSKL